MKSIFRLLILCLPIALISCSKDDDPKTDSGTSELGTYVGTIQVGDDPQTKLGYIYNASVTVTKKGSVATVKIKGDPSFDREYTGEVNAHLGETFDMNIKQQIKPVQKIAGSRLVITGNKLVVELDVANDKVLVKENPASTTTVEISGKIKLIGTDMLKQ